MEKKTQPSPAEQAEAMVAALLQHCRALEITVVRRVGTPTEQPLDRPHMIQSVADLERLMAWLRAENSLRDGQVLVRPYPGQPHPWLILDDLPIPRALAVAGKYAALAVETSTGNSQVRLLANSSLTTEERGRVQAALCELAGADKGSAAGDKWGRLPGFTNRKPSRRGQWTNLLADSTLTLTRPAFDPTPFLTDLHLHPANQQPVAGGVWANPPSPRHDGQGGYVEEFSFACHRLRDGWEPARVIDAVADHAAGRGKRRTAAQARQYAERTVAAALARRFK